MTARSRNLAALRPARRVWRSAAELLRRGHCPACRELAGAPAPYPCPVHVHLGGYARRVHVRMEGWPS